MNKNKARRHLSLLAPLVLLGGCTSMQTAQDDAAEPERNVEVGNTVRVVTHAGQQIEFEVTALDDAAITGVRRKRTGRTVTGYEIDPADRDSPDETLRIPLDDVATVQVREVDGWKMAAVVGGVGAVTLGVFWLMDLLLAAAVTALVL